MDILKIIKQSDQEVETTLVADRSETVLSTITASVPTWRSRSILLGKRNKEACYKRYY